MRVPKHYLAELKLGQIKNSSLGKKFMKGMSLVKDVPDDRDFKISSIAQNEAERMELPTYIDHTRNMSPVKDQGDLGSCVGFACAAMKEFQEKVEHDREVAEGKKYRRERDHYDLSEAWIYWNSKKIDPWPDEEGTSIRCAMKVLHKIGVPCEKAYPYSDTYKGSPAIWSKLIAKWGLIDSYYRCETLEDLKKGLQNGPVVIGIACFREIFYTGDNGNIPYPMYPDEIFGGHAVCAVGYSDNTQQVKFKNSWGNEWGKKGYGFVSYRYINDFMWDAWIAKDISVTKDILHERANDNLTLDIGDMPNDSN